MNTIDHTPTPDVFSLLITLYDTNIPMDFQDYKPPISNQDDDAKHLPSDYAECLQLYRQFRIGKYTFGTYERGECPIYGPYITIAWCYYGSGCYATWNYYLNSETIGKRIDDAPARFGTVMYHSFTHLVYDFVTNFHKYTVKHGRIASEFHVLPMT